MIVVVAGQGRKAGKTSVVTGIVASLADRKWTAIKISPHPHGREWGISEEFSPTTADTGRYLAAGAQRAFWVRAPRRAMDEAAAEVRRIAAESVHTIVESNSILRYLSPDLTIFVLDPSQQEWKPSARKALGRADALILTASGTAPVLAGIVCFRVEPPQYVTPAISAFVRARLDSKFSA